MGSVVCQELAVIRALLRYQSYYTSTWKSFAKATAFKNVFPGCKGAAMSSLFHLVNMIYEWSLSYSYFIMCWQLWYMYDCCLLSAMCLHSSSFLEMWNDCASSPCGNGGTCFGNGTGYTCSCVTGFTGRRCEVNINDCAPQPCLRGTCVDQVNGVLCQCPFGFTGARCETDISFCK